jgi:hypothetical protein
MTDETTASAKSALLATTRPADPVVAAKGAGRFVCEPTRKSPRQKHERDWNARGPPIDDDAGVDAYSITTFCKRHGISESFYHKLKSQGLGPATMRIGTRVLITREAAKAWRRQHTHTPGSAAPREEEVT